MRQKLLYISKVALGGAARRLVLLTALIVSLGCILSPQVAYSQRVIYEHRGVVRDQSGEPLVGVTIFEEESSRGTATDLDGEYTIRLTKEEATLTYSFIGYTAYSKFSNSSKPVSITMHDSHTEIEDVVVIGYGSVKRSDLTGSVVSVGEEIFEDRQVLSLEDALKGQVAGVSVLETDGEPGSTMAISIRGVGSANASNNPLYVIDGVTMEYEDVIISPGEIESIDILKDASSTAIYGSQGANGVVIITTKGAKSGRTQVSYSGSYTIQTPMRLYDMMNSQEYARWTLWGQAAEKGDQTTFVDSDGYEFSYANGEGSNTAWTNAMDVINGINTTDTDWQSEILQNSVLQDHKVTISGSDDKSKFAITGSYFTQTGIISLSATDRYTVRANAERKIYSWLTAGVNVQGSIQEGNKVAIGFVRSLLKREPTREVDSYNDRYELEETTQSSDNYEDMSYSKSVYKNTSATLKGWVEMKFSPTVKLNVSGSYGLNTQKNESYNPASLSSNGGDATAQTIERISYLNDNLLYITPKAFGDHTIDALVGLSFNGRSDYQLKAENEEFEIEDLSYYNLSMGNLPTMATNSYTYSLLASSFARANYNYKGRYLFTATVRADGSTKFGSDNKWGFFPSAAFAWRINDEPFMKNFKRVSNLKYRMSYGISGNQGIGSYRTLATISSSIYPLDGETVGMSMLVDRPENDELKWETSRQYDIGVDVGLFKNRLTATFDVYYKQTRDMLLNESVPSYSGYTSLWTNRGAIDNRGVELQLTAVPFTSRKFRWTSSFNIYANRSKVVHIAEDGGEYIYGTSVNSTSNYFIMRNGEPMGQFYGYKYNGVYTSQQQIVDSGITSFFGNALNPGAPIYEDTNDDGVISEDDRQVLGTASPKFQGGFINSFKYKNVTMKVSFDFSYGGSIYNSTIQGLENSAAYSQNRPSRQAEYGYYPTLYYQSTGELYSTGNESTAYIRGPFKDSDVSTHFVSSLYIEDSSYLRMSDITLSYSFPKKICNRLYMSNLSIYASVKNVFMLTGYSGYSPTVNSGSNVLQPGVDNSAYPTTRNFSIGANISF
ncbi:MAG: TonB-dependent receptor [Rikenellaceae bacterium]